MQAELLLPDHLCTFEKVSDLEEPLDRRLMAAGVKIRYLFYPRAGIGSETYHKSVSVWCAKDRIKAVGIAKAGGKVEKKICDNPVSKHYRLGQRVGVRGTPMIVVDDGRIISGYSPPAAMLATLGLSEKVSKR